MPITADYIDELERRHGASPEIQELRNRYAGPKVEIDPQVIAKKRTSEVFGTIFGLDEKSINATYDNLTKNFYGEELKPLEVQQRMEEDGFQLNPDLEAFDASQYTESMLNRKQSDIPALQQRRTANRQIYNTFRAFTVVDDLIFDEDNEWYRDKIANKPEGEEGTVYSTPVYETEDLLDFDTYMSLLEQSHTKQEVLDLRNERKALLTQLSNKALSQNSDYYDSLEWSEFTTGSKTMDVTLEAAKGLYAAVKTIERGVWSTSLAMGAAWNQPSLERVEEQLNNAKLTPMKAAGKIGYVTNAMAEAIPNFAYNMTIGTAGIFITEYGNARQDALNDGASDTQADLIAVPVATINTIIEGWQIDKIYKLAGMGKGAKQAIRKQIKDRAYKAFLKSGAKFTGASIKTAINEGIEGFTQEGVSIAIPGFIIGNYPKDENGRIDWVTIANRMGQSGIGEGLGGLLLGTGGAVYNARQVQNVKNDIAGGLIMNEGIETKAALEVATNIVERLKNNEGTPKEIYREEVGKVKKADNRTKAAAHIIKKGKQIPEGQYRRIAKETTGKESMVDMTYEEGEKFIAALNQAIPEEVETKEGEVKEEITEQQLIEEVEEIKNEPEIVQPAPQAQAEVPEAEITPKQQNFTQFAAEHKYPDDYEGMSEAIALSSPSGKMSNRARNRANERLKEQANLNIKAHREYNEAVLKGEIIDPSGEVTKEDLQRGIELKTKKEVEGRIAQIDAQIRLLTDVGQGKRGTKPSYQKQINELIAEKEKLTEPSPPSAEKQPWEMTREEYIAKAEKDAEEGLDIKKSGRGFIISQGNQAKIHHPVAIQQALSEGKPVPRNVLEEYKGEKWADEALAKMEAGQVEKIAPEAKAEVVEFNVGDNIKISKRPTSGNLEGIKGRKAKIIDVLMLGGKPRSWAVRLPNGDEFIVDSPKDMVKPSAKEKAVLPESKRRKLLKEAEEEVKKSWAYVGVEESKKAYGGDRLGPISKQKIYINPKYKSEIQSYFGERGKKGAISSLWNMVTFDKTKSVSSWDQSAQERGMEEVSLDDYLQAMLNDYQAQGGRRTIPEYVLDKLAMSQEWQDVALATKIEMLKSGNYTEQQITDTLKEIQLEAEAGTLDELSEKDYDKSIETISQAVEIPEEELEEEREAVQREAELEVQEGDFLEGIKEKPKQKDLLGRPLLEGGAVGKQLGLGLEIYSDAVPPTDVPTKIVLQNEVAKALNQDAQKVLDSKRKYKGVKDEKQLYEKYGFADKNELFIHPDKPYPEMRAAWTIATKGKGLFRGGFLSNTPFGNKDKLQAKVDEVMSLAEAPPEVSVEEKKKSLKELKRTDTLATFVNTAESAVKSLDRAFGIMSTRIKNISPKLFQEVRNKYINPVKMVIVDRTKKVHPFVDAIEKFSDEDAYDFEVARWTENIEEVERLIKKHNIQSEYDKYRIVFDLMYHEGKAVGMDMNYVTAYFPSKVKDLDGLLKELNRREQYAPVVKALRDAQDKKGRPLAREEQIQIIDTLLRGFRTTGLTLAPPGFTRARTLIREDIGLIKYYYGFAETTSRYIESMTENIQARKFFGKQTKEIVQLRANISRNKTNIAKWEKELTKTEDSKEVSKIEGNIKRARERLTKFETELLRLDDGTLKNSIGDYVLNLIEDGTINYDQQVELRQIFDGLFGNVGSNRWIHTARSLEYVGSLAQVPALVTQYSEVVLSVLKAPGGTLPNWVRAHLGKSKIKLQDIGVAHIGQEWADADLNAKMTWLLQWFEKVDKVGKETFINSVVEKYRKLAETNPDKVREELNKYYPESQHDAIIESLKSGTIDNNIKGFALNELADVQPISKMEVPELYAKAGNLRVFYMYKTFTLKRLDIMRNQAYGDIKKGIKTGSRRLILKGLAKLVWLVFMFTMADSSADVVKDIIRGRPIDELPDYIVDNLLQMILLSKYSASKVGKEGLSSFFRNNIALPVSNIDAATRDFMTLIDEDSEKGSETLRRIPWIGDLYYWYFGEGARKIEEGYYD